MVKHLAGFAHEQHAFGYRDPRSINIEDYANREAEGVLLVRKAGEMLYHLTQQPKWAGGR